MGKTKVEPVIFDGRKIQFLTFFYLFQFILGEGGRHEQKLQEIAGIFSKRIEKTGNPVVLFQRLAHEGQ